MFKRRIEMRGACWTDKEKMKISEEGSANRERKITHHVPSTVSSS